MSDGMPLGAEHNFATILFGIAKANQDAYLAAYHAGFRAGYAEAMSKSLEIINGAAERATARDEVQS